MFPETTIQTELGAVRVVATDYNHVAVSTIDVGVLIVNGVRYKFHGHLNRYEDAVRFQPLRTYYDNRVGASWSDDIPKFHEANWCSLTRADNYKDGTEAAKKKVRSVIVDAVDKFLTTDDGRTLLDTARGEDFGRRLRDARQAVEDARAKLIEAEENVRKIITEDD